MPTTDIFYRSWNDAPSNTILSQIAAAMAPDSVVIVDEVIMPQVRASWKQCSMDLAMMTMLAAMERTKEHFAQLFKEAGLQLRDVWTYDYDYGDSFIVGVPLKTEEPVAAESDVEVDVVVNGANGPNDSNGH